jgi:hypothetical protein
LSSMGSEEPKIGAIAVIDKNSLKYGTLTGQYLVVSKRYPSDERRNFAVDLLVLSSKADAEAVAEYLSLEADDSIAVPAAVKRTYDNIIANHLPPAPRVNPLVEVKRGSWYHVTSKWRELLGDLGADVSDLIGQVVPLLAALDEDGGPVLLRNARIDRTDEDTNFLVVVAKVNGGAEEEFQVSAVSVRAALGDSPDAVDDADTFNAVGMTASVIALFNACPLSSRVVGDSNISRREVEEFLTGAGVADLHVGADTGERDVFLRFSVRSICSAAENAGQSLSLDNGKLPTVPSRLGKVLAEAGGNLPPSADEDKDDSTQNLHTLSELLEKRAKHANEWNKFLEECIVTCVTQPDKRDEIRASASRTRAALERALIRFGCTPARVVAVGAAKSCNADDLMCFLDAIAESPVQTPTGDRKDTSSHDSSSLRAPPGSRSSLGKSKDAEAEVKLSVKTSALALIEDKVAYQRLEKMFALAQIDPDEVQRQLNQESNEHLVRLVSAPVENMEQVLAGCLADVVTTKVLKVREALDKRVERMVLGEDDEPTERVSSQIKRARRLEIHKVKLLELLDKKDSSTKESPLGGFASLSPASAGEDFALAVTRLRDIVTVTKPSMGPSAMAFFRELTERVRAARARGAPWEACSQFWRAVFKKVEAHSVSFASGAQDVSMHGLILDISWVTDYSFKHSRLLEEAIIDSKKGGKQPDNDKRQKRTNPGKGGGGRGDGKGKGAPKKGKRQKRKGKSKPAAAGDDDNTDADDDEDEEDEEAEPVPDKAAWGCFIPDHFGASTKKAFADAEAKHGKEASTGRLPCAFHFMGKCDPSKRKGKQCSFWHF